MVVLGDLDASYALTNEQWDCLTGIRDVLKPFKRAQKSFECEKYVTASLVQFLIQHFRQGLNSGLSHESKVVKRMTGVLLKDFKLDGGKQQIRCTILL